ncbi:uncharacterized protein LOC110760655 [Prunus avium]|uniref:Uncharacterized protein LOC110760655 n=1 Tax=Prunus avium TaxID=42229 RepID=A0A6P5SY83_PRUAV|nr:uncharacterized protein LOC110760655 [Prunus avium]
MQKEKSNPTNYLIAYIRDLTKQPSSTKRAQEHLATKKKTFFNLLCELTKMASTQCHNKPAAKEGSLGQKVSEIAGFLRGGHHGEYNSSISHTTSTQYCLATPATNGQHGLNQHHATTGLTRHGTKKRGERKNKKTGGSRNLLQKIKDGISGHSSESSSSSSSDSENEGCQKKN